MNYKDIKLEMTCGACPEQYDALYDDEVIGYLRLRHGYFRVEYFVNEKQNIIVYESKTKGDGIFEDKERKGHLKTAKKAILKAYKKKIKL